MSKYSEQDKKDAMSKESERTGGPVPSGSGGAQIQSKVDQKTHMDKEDKTLWTDEDVRRLAQKECQEHGSVSQGSLAAEAQSARDKRKHQEEQNK